MHAIFRRFMLPLFIGGFFVFSSVQLFAENFPFDPPENFKLNPKYIALHHPVQTENITAQLYFDQGLTFLYAFNHDAAYWSFLRASESDPKLAMAYWGMALSLGTNINMSISQERSIIAYAAIQKAVQLSLNGPESEKGYIQALARRYAEDSREDQKKLGEEYSKAMRDLSDKYPDDLDAAVLFAESLLDLNPWNQWSTDGSPRAGTLEAVKKLESVLKRAPNHLGANHYYIHVLEASSYPEAALMSAERLKTLLPSSGHVLHMPSHIYMLVGDYHQAAASNEAAIAADREYIRMYGIRGIYPVHYLSHNYYVMVRALIAEGRFEDAKKGADELAKFYLPHYHQMPELEYFAITPLTVLIAFHRWDDILEMPKPPEAMAIYEVLWRFARALSYAKLGDLQHALLEQNLFLNGKAKLPRENVFGYNSADNIFKIAEYTLDAQIAEARGSKAQAADLLGLALKEQEALQYNEPPDWFFPIRERLGGLYLRMQKPAEAEAVFRQELVKSPRNGRALFGLKESLNAQSKTHDLYWVNEEFEKAWMYSDITLNINSL